MTRLSRALLVLALLAGVPAIGSAAGSTVDAAAKPASHDAKVDDLPDAETVEVPRPTAHYAARAEAVPFELFRGTRMFLRGAINGSDTEMMLDTGASSTVLDTKFARSLGIAAARKFAIRGAGGRTPGELGLGVTIQVGGLTLRDAGVLIMDLTPIATAIGRPIPVILGHDAIDAGPVRIDFPGRTMTFIAADTFVAPKNAQVLPLGHDGPFRAVGMSVAGLPSVSATFDIGNGGTIVLAKSYWTTQPALASLPYAQSVIGGVGGFKPARRVTLPEVQFAGQTLKAVPALLNEDADALPTEGGNVGIEMLKPFVVTADYANDRIYAEPSAAWEGFRRERAGLMTMHHGDRLRVPFVSKDGPAAAAGLKAGDEIVAIDGRKIGGDFYATRDAEWNMAPAGTKVVVTRADGSDVALTLRDYY